MEAKSIVAGSSGALSSYCTACVAFARICMYRVKQRHGYDLGKVFDFFNDGDCRKLDWMSKSNVCYTQIYHIQG